MSIPKIIIIVTLGFLLYSVIVAINAYNLAMPAALQVEAALQF